MRARVWSLVLAGLLGVVVSPFHEQVGAQTAAGVPRVVISEYRFRGPSGSSDEFVELFNAGTADADVSGWRLRSSTDSGTSSVLILSSGTIIKRGCFYLIANSTGYSAGVTPDRTFVNATSDTGGMAILNATSTTIFDQVGNSPSTVYGEGTRLPAFTASTANQSYERRTDPAAGFVDTNNNAADFQLISPATPRNRNQENCLTPVSLTVNVGASPTSAEQGQQVLVLATVTPATLPGSTDVQVTGDLSALGGPASAVFADNGVSPDAAAGDNVFTSAVVVPYSTPLGARSVTVTAVDAQARTATHTAAIDVVGPAVMYMPHEVQGAGASSPLPNGTLATVRGVVTARTADGFFFQTQSGLDDADPQTSEGLFVRTDGPVPAAAAVAHFVQVTGAVNERGSPSLTELHPVTAVHDLGNSGLPDAHVLTTDDLSDAGDADQLERFEGMRVMVPSLTAVSGTGADGAFFGVITGQARPFREPGVEPGAAVLPCAIGPCNVPLFDGNPERLRVDSDALAGTSAVHVSTSAVISDVAGPLGFESGAFTIFAESLDAAGGMDTTAAVAAAANQFTVASFSLGGALDANRLEKASSMVRDILNMPDIVGVQDVAALADLTALAQAVDADAASAGQPAPQYSAEWFDGADGLGTGVLLKTAGGRVSAPPATQVGAGMTIVDPADGSEHPLFDRPSVLVQATVTGPPTVLPQNVTVLVNHLAPQAGVALDDSDGVLVREKRKAQAELLANFVQARQGEALVSLGDYNAFSFNDGYVDTVGTIAGTPAPADEVALSTTDFVTPDLLNVGDQGALWDLYSSIANGNAQALDHALITATLESQVVGVARPRVNADFPAADGADQHTPNRLSDRDPMVVYFTFPADVTPPALHGVPGSVVVEATGPAGATVSFVLPTATDNLDPSVTVVCLPASGTTFAFVNSGVTCTAQDDAGNTTSESFSVTVRDTTGPSLTMPADMTVEASSAAGAAVTFGATATDAVTPSPVVTCSPASGSTFALAVTTVQCSSQDAAGNTSNASFLVTVQDTVAPVLSVPGNITGEATSADGLVVSFTATATDAVTTSPAVDCAPVSGSTFAVGDTVVTCAAADAAGNVATGSFTVTVTSTAPPPVFGHVAGVGSVIQDEQRVWFAFDVRERAWGERGWVRLQVRGEHGRADRYLAAGVSAVQMSNAPEYSPGPTPKSGIDTVAFTGTGSWNGVPGYRFEITASDRGEPGRGRDGFSLTVFAPNGAVVESVSGLLRDGNIRSLR